LVAPARVELAAGHRVPWQSVRESNSCQRIESPFAEPAPRHAPQIWQPAWELNPYRRLERAPSEPLEERPLQTSGAADRVRTGICSIDNRELSPFKLQPRVYEVWWVWKDSNPQCSKELRVYGPVGQPVAPTHPTLGGEGASRTRKSRRHVPPRTGRAFQMPNATVAVGAGLEPAHAFRREPRLRRGAMPFRSPYRLNKLMPPLQRFCDRIASDCSMQCWRRRSDSNGWCPFEGTPR
jgi:hypothetical protein